MIRCANYFREYIRKGFISCSYCLFVCATFIFHYSGFSQIDTWQSHVSYLSAQSVAVVSGKVYAASQNGFFYYDTSTQETTLLDKNSGLSDAGISRILYLSDQNRLLIAYQNGSLDFLSVSETGEPTDVKNIKTIRDATTLPTSRTINHLNRIDDNVYISTDFGLVVLNIRNDEIRDTYFSLKADDTPLRIYQTVATSDSLFALTDPLRSTETGKRLQAIRFLTTVNLADPANWQTVSAPSQQIESICSYQGELSVSVNGQGIYERQAGKWQQTQALSNTIIRLFSVETGLIVATNQSVTLPGGSQTTGTLLANPREVAVSGNTLWIADTQNGLLSGNAGTLERITPEGPTHDTFASLYTYSNTLIALPGSQQADSPLQVNQAPFDVLSVSNQRWTSQQAANITKGFNAATYVSTTQTLYWGSFGEGLWSQQEGQSLTSVALPTTASNYITSLTTDLDGNVWITTNPTTQQSTSLHALRSNGQFQSFSSVSTSGIRQIIADDYGFLWMRLSSGLLVFDPQTNQSRFLSTISGQGGLLSNSVRAMAKDRNGAIWIGTDLGPMVFDNPAGAFESVIDAQAPISNQRKLLANEIVTSITVDGGNRKWIGTPDGLYYVETDGSQLLNTFTIDNSPLPTNYIQALAFEPISGKVFMVTGSTDRSYGILSYRSSSTEPAESLRQLTIFPNPVRPDFTGTVGINGLTENATVKILDAGGQLVYETRSQGGTAAWNLQDYRGRQAQTGIYLVVVVTSNGSQGLAGKIAVIR